MLRSSLVEPDGASVQQVVVTFLAGTAADSIVRAWERTVAETEALRIAFEINDGEPVGIIPLRIENGLRVEANPPADWETWLESDRQRALRLDGGRPWRAVFWPSLNKLVWTVHHALLDGRSITAIVRAFRDRVAGQEPGPLRLKEWSVPDPLQVEAAQAHYRVQLGRVEEGGLEFPGDSAGRRCVLRRRLGRQMADRLEAVAVSMESSSATLITWAWGQAVLRASGLQATAIGQVRSGPRQPGSAGFSMNTLTVVVERAAAGPLEGELRQFRRQLQAMRRFEAVSPLDVLTDRLGENGGPWPGGILMVEHGTLAHQVGLGNRIESITMLERSNETLLASAWIRPELELEVEVSGIPFGPVTAETLLDLWEGILGVLVQTEAPHATDLDALPAAMQARLSAWESGGEPLDHRHLAQVWRESVAAFGPQTAILGPEGPLSYDQLDARVAHLAARLEDHGVTRGTVVACLLKERPRLAEVLLALSRLGAIYLPIDADLPDLRRRTILEDATPALILSEARETVEAYGFPMLEVDGAVGRVPSGPMPDEPRDPLAMLYTSGSTGVPKGVIMVHGGIINECRCAIDLAKLGPGDRLLQFASPGFDTCLEELIAPLISGATLVPRPERIKTDLIEFQRFLEFSQITVLDLPTAHWAAWSSWMAAEGGSVPRCVRATIIGGERATAAALGDWFRATTDEQVLINTYGPTEASIAATGEFIRGDWSESGDPAIGRPFPGLLARVADSQGRPLPVGAAGELWLGGIAIGPGYWRRPERSAQVFRQLEGTSWYRTGDRVYWDDQGRLHFIGRKDDQLKIRGNRVEPREVTRVLESYPGVTAAHAGPVKRPDGSVALGAWIRWETAPDSAWPSRLAAFAAERLPAAAVPSRWCAVDTFELNERGKLDRHRLPEPLLTGSNLTTTEPPATPTEAFLASIWCDLLNVSVVGRDESFFELGGDSMAALRLFARIHTERRLRVPMATLIQAPSLRQLGKAMDLFAPAEEPAATGHPLIVAMRSEGNSAPLFCVHGGDGGVIFYRQLAKHLPPDRPVFAIESPFLGTVEEVLSVPIEESAARYVSALRRIQPAGPYHLLGYCYGGLLVYEMTRILLAAGESVAFTGLVDAINPRVPLAEYSVLDRARISWRASHSPRPLGRLAHLGHRLYTAITDRARVEWQTLRARCSGHAEPYSEVRATQVRDAHLRSEESFHPQPLEAKVVLFICATENDKYVLPEDYGWSTLVKQQETIKVPGKHLTIFDEGNVSVLAQEIASRL